MKNTILLDTGILSLYNKNDQSVVREIETKKRQNFYFVSSEVNYIELFIYTTETHFNDVENLKTKKFDS